MRTITITLLLCLLATAPIRATDQPNIVFLLADDLGWTGLGCCGSDFYETPRLDALAADGMRFTNAYAACTVCSPTRASILTGMYPARLRLTDFIAGQNRPFAKLRIPDWTKRLTPEAVTLAEALQTAGYTTGHIGKWHLHGRGSDSQGTDPISQGFDVSISRPPGTKGYRLKQGVKSKQGTSYLTDWLTDQACDFIDDAKSKPFFLYFAYNVPHTPIQGRPDLVEYFSQKVDTSKTHQNPIYAAMVASLDESVGRVLQRLDDHGLTNKTIVVFTSDNGGLTQRFGKHDGFTENLPLRRGKGSAYEGGVRVPAIVRWPGVTAPGSTCAEPIMTIDYYPTLLSIAGARGDAQHNASVDGVDLSSLLRNQQRQLHRKLFWHYPHYHAGGDGPYSAVRDGKYRLIHSHENNSVRLYDLDEDIGEQHNLAAELPAKTQALKAALFHWRDSLAAQMPAPNPDHDPTRATQVRKSKPQ